MTTVRASAPTATYRLQLQPGFGFAEARLAVPYLARLGVSHLHLSPVLEAVPGSRHGYDVVDHGRVSEQLGGEEGPSGLRALADQAHAHGLGIVVDTVPNHMAAPVPASLNEAWFALLREGPSSPYADWFDVDWAAQGGRVLLPVLGERIADELPELKRDVLDGVPVLRHHDQVFPLRAGTERLPLPELLDHQFYRLAWWPLARTELNYRRFFTVSDLVGVRVEHPEVFRRTHATLLRLHAEGVVDGFRIDHPDGLADPRGYLRTLAEATGGAYTVVEKILTGDEELPADWDCAGTTGYDALRRIDGVLTDSAGAAALAEVYTGYLGSGYLGAAADSATAAARRGRTEMTAPLGELAAEVNRLARLAERICAETPLDEAPELRDHAPWALRQVLADTLAAYPVYRPYPVPGEPDDPADLERLTAATAAARARLDAHHAATADLVRDLALGRHGRGPAKDEFRTRLAQTASAVAAKGVEDTAFYRRYPLLSLNEVGGDPARPGLPPEEFHAYCVRLQRDRPAAMTVLSTHDTKRSADARARLAVLAELPEEWRAEIARWTGLCPEPVSDPNAAYLLWQTAVAAWPIDADRLAATALKSVREAKLRTTWTEPDPGYEHAVEQLARAIPETPALAAAVAAFVERTARHARVNTLSAALLHLTMPGVPDLYQGSEEPLYTLVDPDNRHPVDLAALAARLDPADPADPAAPGATADDDPLRGEKLHLTATALRLRRARPEVFAGRHTPLPTRDEHLLGYLRGDGGEVLALATRLPHRLERRGGWTGQTLTLPPGRWTETLSGREDLHGDVRVADLLDRLPVALLARDTDADTRTDTHADTPEL
ncbi:malto-oligosyltrehalose synthase [Streptacidiphilus cavernicola]|uniref:Malto-oligosyltrehalose synthase n=1 Tax=Streptacidiphilus cavernicola TaxID=3342716 RepID=A0ABV6VRB9_9ACTN